MERIGADAETAAEFAEACFEAQDGEFSTAADYNPEDCADEVLEFYRNFFIIP